MSGIACERSSSSLQDNVGKGFAGSWVHCEAPALPPAECAPVLPARGAVSSIPEGPGSEVEIRNNQPGRVSWLSISYGGAAGMLGTNLSGEEGCVQNVSESVTDQ